MAGLDETRAHGFEGVQLPVDVVMERDDADFPAERKRLSAAGLSFEVFEAPLPKGVQVTEQGFNTYYWTEYLGTAVRRISELGCRTLVWGDGRSRLLPVEGDVSTAREHFYQFMFMLCGIAERFGIDVCLEPLGARRTNFINSFEDIRECFSMLDKPNLAVLVSPRDLVELHAGMSEMTDCGQRIGHVHLEHPEIPGSSVPPRSSDRYDYVPFMDALRRMDYDGVVSLPPGSGADSLAYCRRLWDQSVAAE